MTDGLYQTFIDLRDSQLVRATSFEENAQYEMAYLALWSVVEKSIKSMYPHAQKAKLLECVIAWKLFLEGSTSLKPSEIKKFTYGEPENIPSDLSAIEQLFGSMPKVCEILNTDPKKGSTKWRTRRNNIAHDALAFAKQTTFLEYKQKLIEGIREIERAMLNSEKIKAGARKS